MIGLVLTMLLNSLATRMLSSGSSMEISYTEFMDKVRDGAIAGVNIQDSEGRLVALPDDSDDTPRGVIYYIVGYNGQDPDLIQTLEDYDVDTSIAIPEEVSPIISMLVSWVLPLLIVWWLMSFMSRKLMGKMGGGLGGINKSNAKIYMQNGTGVTFKDVAGQDEAKESLMEIVDYLHNPQNIWRSARNFQRALSL